MKDTTISSVFAWEAFDSRGTPTVACEVVLGGGASGSATVPSGASTGRYEAHELRDGGLRYGGLGVRSAVESVNRTLGPGVAGLDAADQRGVDRALRELDGTPDLSRLGANAVLAVSVAAALAAAGAGSVPLHRALDPAGLLLPLPMVNIVSGGAHARGAGVDVQDFLAVPVGAASFAEAIEWAWRVRTSAGELARERGLPASLVADEGGLGLSLASNRAGLELLVEAIERAGFVPGGEVSLAVDVAATQLAVPGGYELASEQRVLTSTELVDELDEWCSFFPIVSLEDPLAEDDWPGWHEITTRLGGRVQLLGDDLFVTNVDRLAKGIEEGAANAVLVKPNQIGTLSGALDAVERARAAGYATVVSARSGDTEDAWLADLAVGWRAGQIKVGSTARSERTAKWNRLLWIEAAAGGSAHFAGREALAP